MRILIAHWRHLEPDMNSGDLRLYEIIRLLREQGHRVVFLPGNLPEESPACLQALDVTSPGSVATFVRSPRRFALFLLRQNFDCAILSPYRTFEQLSLVIRQTLPRCAIVLDTIDLFHVREQRLAALSGDPQDLAQAKRTYEAEWNCLRAADAVWVVAETERAVIAPALKAVSVVPNIHRVAAPIMPYGQREGIVFLGGYAHAPNVDAVHHFVKAILPLLRKSLPTVPILIAGSNPPEEFKELARVHGLNVTGYVPDHRALLGSCRVGIAPLRYGAGMKGKIGEYLACGLPTVTSSIGAEGMNLQPGLDALITDEPTAFAQYVIKAYHDQELWQTLSTAGPRYIERTLSPNAVSQLLGNALKQVRAENRRKHEEGILTQRNRFCVATKLLGGKLLDKCRSRQPTATAVLE